MVDTVTKPVNSRPDAKDPDTQGPVLVLRCCGPSRVGQIVRLKSDKCTIGSNPGCTLRLRARGVKPLHCLILRGRAETVIRRWAPDTRLNGQPFSDAPLLVGDRLSIGPIEFEVLDPSVQPPTQDDSPADLQDDSPADLQDDSPADLQDDSPADVHDESRDDVRSEDVRQLWDLDQLATRLRLSNHQGRRRVRRMIEHLRRARKEITQLQDSRASDTQRSDAAELQKKRTTLEEVQRRWEDARAEAETQLKERAGQLDDRMTELEAERARLRRQQSEWEAGREEAETQLAARAEKIDTREAELDARLAEAPRPQPRADDSTQQKEQAAPSPPSSESGALEPFDEGPANSEEIFQRLAVGMPVPAAGKPQLEDGPELAPAPESQPVSQIFDGRMARKWPQTPDSADDNDESVDQYMTRLLERVRGATGDQPSDDPPESPPCETGSVESAESTATTEMAGTSGESSDPLSSKEEGEIGEPGEQEPVEIPPRTAAPERQENLWAMRELANASAQTAIHRHMRSRILRAGYVKLAAMSLGLLGGTASIWIWANDAHSPLALAAAVVGFAVAAFFGVWYALLVGQLIFGPSDGPMDEPQEDAEPTDEPSEAPEEDLSAELEEKGPSLNGMLQSGEVYALVDGTPRPVAAPEPSADQPWSEPPDAQPTAEEDVTASEEGEIG